MRSEAKDPRSLFYERVTVRPKIPTIKLLLLIFAIFGSSATAYIGLLFLFHNHFISAVCAVIIAFLVGVLLAKHLLIVFIKIYQATAPIKVRNRCRYEPSCSAYMILAVEKYGFWRGFKKGIKRWRGCKPPNGGFDEP